MKELEKATLKKVLRILIPYALLITAINLILLVFSVPGQVSFLIAFMGATLVIFVVRRKVVAANIRRWKLERDLLRQQELVQRQQQKLQSNQGNQDSGDKAIESVGNATNKDSKKRPVLKVSAVIFFILLVVGGISNFPELLLFSLWALIIILFIYAVRQWKKMFQESGIAVRDTHSAIRKFFHTLNFRAREQEWKERNR